MSAEIIPLYGEQSAEKRHAVSPESIEFLGGLLVAMAQSMNGQRYGMQMNPCECTMRMLKLVKEIDQEPI